MYIKLKCCYNFATHFYLPVHYILTLKCLLYFFHSLAFFPIPASEDGVWVQISTRSVTFSLTTALADEHLTVSLSTPFPSMPQSMHPDVTDAIAARYGADPEPWPQPTPPPPPAVAQAMAAAAEARPLPLTREQTGSFFLAHGFAGALLYTLEAAAPGINNDGDSRGSSASASANEGGAECSIVAYDPPSLAFCINPRHMLPLFRSRQPCDIYHMTYSSHYNQLRVNCTAKMTGIMREYIIPVQVRLNTRLLCMALCLHSLVKSSLSSSYCIISRQ